MSNKVLTQGTFDEIQAEYSKLDAEARKAFRGAIVAALEAGIRLAVNPNQSLTERHAYARTCRLLRDRLNSGDTCDN